MGWVKNRNRLIFGFSFLHFFIFLGSHWDVVRAGGPSHMYVYLAKALAIGRGSNWLWEEGTELGHVHLLFTSLKSKLI